MSKCAVIKDNLVNNIIVAEPTDILSDDSILVLIPDNVFVNIGFTWDGTNFIDLEGNPSLPYEELLIELLVEDSPPLLEEVVEDSPPLLEEVVE
jgi:hypothetical protein